MTFSVPSPSRHPLLTLTTLRKAQFLVLAGPKSYLSLVREGRRANFFLRCLWWDSDRRRGLLRLWKQAAAAGPEGRKIIYLTQKRLFLSGTGAIPPYCAIGYSRASTLSLFVFQV